MTDGAPSKYNNYDHTNHDPYGWDQFDYKEYVVSNDLNAAETLKEHHQNAEIYTIGFDVEDGNSPYEGINFSGEECQSILQRIATDNDHYISATDTADLNEAFSSIGTNIRKAGTEAVVTDIIGSAYRLQKTTSQGFNTDPVIEVKSYNLNAEGNRTGEPRVLETVSFSNGGNTVTSSVKEVQWFVPHKFCLRLPVR